MSKIFNKSGANGIAIPFGKRKRKPLTVVEGGRMKELDSRSSPAESSGMRLAKRMRAQSRLAGA